MQFFLSNLCYFKKQNNKTLNKFEQNLTMSLLKLIFIFDIVKNNENIVSVDENIISTKLKFNLLKILTMIKISISQHFSIKRLSLNNKFEQNSNRKRFINISLLKLYPSFPLKVKKVNFFALLFPKLKNK